MIKLFEKEQIDDLEYKGLRIIQREGCYHFTSDSVLLANLVKARKSDRVLDMGTGSGIIAILIAGKTLAKEIVGIDIQSIMVDMATRSVELNNLQDRVQIKELDINEATKALGYNSFDIVVCNPPYTKESAGALSNSEHVNICRREVRVTLDKIIENASKLVKSGGYFYIIHKAERLAEVIKLMIDNNFAPKLLYNVHPKQHLDADTIIIQAKKDANQNMKIKTIVIYENDNTYSEFAKKLYKKE